MKSSGTRVLEATGIGISSGMILKELGKSVFEVKATKSTIVVDGKSGGNGRFGFPYGNGSVLGKAPMKHSFGRRVDK